MNDLLNLECNTFLEEKDSNLNKYSLTVREKEIGFLINKGLKNRIIGEILYISETTVKKHIYNIFRKININSRIELICLLRDGSSVKYLDVAS
ncbi:MAG: helix-turn-helix transcriptional regulator [Spirochaetaceae bacterium]